MVVVQPLRASSASLIHVDMYVVFLFRPVYSGYNVVS